MGSCLGCTAGAFFGLLDGGGLDLIVTSGGWRDTVGIFAGLVGWLRWLIAILLEEEDCGRGREDDVHEGWQPWLDLGENQVETEK